MEKDDQAEDEEKGDEVADNSAPEGVQMRQEIRPHDAVRPAP